ncbi:helix-turn-helix domain-containing protein, partial [Methanothrix sp.]|uniref:helix-turn-helix transcriptional regulator n=1 Tax=Methanothrix sp. TaxID=90426 RepID=UPI00329A2A6E
MRSVALLRKLVGAGLLLILASMAMASATGQDFDSEVAGKNLSLDVYLYDSGKALVAGYVDSTEGLTFLEPARYAPDNTAQYTSKYRFDNQLYAWTDALTSKQRENWSLMFSCDGFYNEYHVIFHLPNSSKLGRINSSKGLSYLVSTSNDSLIVESQGYRVNEPVISIEYRQHMEPEGNEQEGITGNISRNGDSSNVDNNDLNQAYLLLILLVALAIGSLIIFIVRRRAVSPKVESSIPEAEDFPDDDQALDALSTESDQMEASEEDVESEEMPSLEEGPKKEIAVSSEMMAVMDALTPREHSIVEALIKCGGRMTQAEIRYETNLPRSTLTTILVSLERRNLITKKEWGRTN